jgi:hypothetical protein
MLSDYNRLLEIFINYPLGSRHKRRKFLNRDYNLLVSTDGDKNNLAFTLINIHFMSDIKFLYPNIMLGSGGKWRHLHRPANCGS